MKKKMADEESFFEKVYDVVRQIPYGKVTSYGAIANAIGSPQASRMVGWAMNNAHGISPYVPAHRVVNRNGLLTGKMHFGGSDVMADLLKSEGICVENDKIINFNEVFWDPMLLEIHKHD
ncbi:MAG: MGMT family protein [Bacteroidales bacterium]|jgi:methylated-DNA-protein-cysteine methyltransferase-like protein|nr:MGMT family protein [Bacteroidales bacterium]